MCYICACDLSKVVAAWLRLKPVDSSSKSATESLQDMVEVVMTLKQAAESGVGRDDDNAAMSEDLCSRLAQYAGLLAAQGALAAALTYLGKRRSASATADYTEVGLLRERLAGALKGTANDPNAAANNNYNNRSSVGRTASGQQQSRLAGKQTNIFRITMRLP